MMVRAAIAGLGRWGQNLVGAVQGKSQRITFVRGMVRHPAEIAEFAEAKGFTLCDRFEDLLADPLVDAVVLATPHDLHADQIVAAARAGKSVFCEKPLALRRSDAQRAIAACAEAGVALGVGHDKRFWPSMRELKKVATEGTLGKLLHIEGNISNENSNVYRPWRLTREASPGGSLTSTGIHILDAFVNLMGPARRLQASFMTHGEAADVQDSMAMIFDFRNGTSGLLASVRPTPFFWRVHVFGTRGSAESRGPNEMELRLAGEQPRSLHFEALDALRYELEAFADAAAGVAPYPISPAEMLLTVATLEAAAKAVDTGTAVVVE